MESEEGAQYWSNGRFGKCKPRELSDGGSTQNPYMLDAIIRLVYDTDPVVEFTILWSSMWCHNLQELVLALLDLGPRHLRQQLHTLMRSIFSPVFSQGFPPQLHRLPSQ